jgi:hypothetical protein
MADKKVIELANGTTLIRTENGPPGGYSYVSDEIGGGVLVWDTCLVDPETLRTALKDFEEGEDG